MSETAQAYGWVQSTMLADGALTTAATGGAIRDCEPVDYIKNVSLPLHEYHTGALANESELSLPLRLSDLWYSCRSLLLPGGGPGLARVCGAGFLFQEDVPGEPGSCSPFAGV